jgi:cyclase
MRRMLWLCALVAICGVCFDSAVHAQSVAQVARDSSASLFRVADGIYAVIHDDAINNYPTGVVEWPHGNTGFIVGKKAVLVIDTNLFPSRAAADIRLLQKVTDKPVRYVVNTHWHGDHTHGNSVYAAAYRDAIILGAAENQQLITLNQLRYPLSVTRDSSNVRRLLRSYQQLLAAGVDSVGKALADKERMLLQKVVAQLSQQLIEFANIRPASPSLLFTDSIIVDLGGRIAIVSNQGRANSPADVTVYVPGDSVLFTGDIVVHPVPFAFGAYPGPWIPVVRKLEAIPVKAVIPGHGPVMRDHAYTTKVRRLLEATMARVEALLRRGHSLAEVQSLVELSDLRKEFVQANDSAAGMYWDASIKDALVERSYQCVTGYRC